MSATLARFVLSAVIRDGKIELRGPYNETLHEWYHSLPGARWNKPLACWVCDVTPAACWRIMSEQPGGAAGGAAVEADEEIQERGHKFFAAVNSEPELHLQPRVRKLDSWRHQVGAYRFAVKRDATLLAMGMGTGKTKVAVDFIQNMECRRTLIVCPVSVRGVWRREVDRWQVEPIEVLVLESGSVTQKTKAAREWLLRMQARNLPAVVVVNYETMRVGTFSEWAGTVDWDLIVADESHRAKSPSGQTSKALAKLGRKAQYRLALSGTPMAHSPLDIYAQFLFLEPGIFGTSWHRFRAYYAINGPLGAQHIVGFKNQDDLARRMGLITYQVGREVLDLPDAQHIERTVDLEPESRRVYDEMADDLIAFLDDGNEITAPNSLVKLLRLSQITSGHCKTDDGVERLLGHEKRNALDDILADAGEPVVVCCKFIRDLDTVMEVCEGAGLRYGEISGRRKDLTEHGTMPDGIDVMAVQEQAGGVGIDLTRARLCVFFSVGYSLSDYDQFCARVHRPGQDRPVVYYHLVAADTVDQAIYKAIEKKRDIIETVLEFLKGTNA